MPLFYAFRVNFSSPLLSVSTSAESAGAWPNIELLSNGHSINEHA